MGNGSILEFLKKASEKIRGLKREINDWEKIINNLRPRETSEYLEFEERMNGDLKTMEGTLNKETKRTKEKITKMVNLFIERLNEKS